ncbi:hypothetical protein JCM18916_3283 [Cutibacterium acnes JCM 18916]|nr:hypothetical protein JCM18916_3283 [Cutibacterium acnes JCM 18916]
MFWQNLRHLWRRRDFRKILGVRVATQAADGTLQVGMASYVLLSPEQQPDAWSIAMVLAITLLPFSIIGPFVSVVLDRWSRQRILVYTDGLRCLIAVGLGILVWNGARDKPSHLALLIGLLIAMSLNRFLLTALVAGLEYTIDKRDYLTASSIMPTIGPLGLMIGAVVAAAVRMIAGRHIPVHHADTIIFCISAALFAVSVALGLQFSRRELGPPPVDRSRTMRAVAGDVVDGFRYLGKVPLVGHSLTLIGAQRVLFGVYSVAMILGYRNRFHVQSDINGAMADMTVWAVAMGAGFVLSAGFMPVLVHRLGMRRALMALLTATAVIQLSQAPPRTVGVCSWLAFFVGLFAQSLKPVSTPFARHTSLTVTRAVCSSLTTWCTTRCSWQVQLWLHWCCLSRDCPAHT